MGESAQSNLLDYHSKMNPSALDIIQRYTTIDGANIIDIGCGKGAIGAKISALGGRYTGVDPQADERAGLVLGSAEQLPFADNQFDCALFINALHHVPIAQMASALLEAERVVQVGGRVIIIEPAIKGALTRVLAIVDDETAVRTAALSAINDAIAAGIFDEIAEGTYNRRERFSDFNQFKKWSIAVDKNRTKAFNRYNDVIEQKFTEEVIRKDGVAYLNQPMNFYILAPRQTSGRTT